MNILKKYFLFAAVALSSIGLLHLFGCTTPIIMKNMSADEPGYFMYGKIPERNFYEPIVVEEVIPAWNGETSGSQSFTSAILYNKAIFVSDLSGRLYAFDRLTGEKIGYEKFEGAISVTPVLNKLRLFFVVNEKLENYSLMIMFDFISGKKLQEQKIDGSVTNELLKLDDGIVVVTDRGEVIKFNFAGIRVWSYKTKVTCLSSPASNGKVIIIGNQQGEIISIDSQTGNPVNKFKLTNAFSSGITIDKDNAYFCDETGILYSYNIDSNKILWKFDLGAKVIATPVFDDEKIYVGNLNGDLLAVSKHDGKLIWNKNNGGVFNTTPLLTKNSLVQPDLNKKVFFIDVKNGETKKVLTFDRRVKLSPVYYDGILYLGSDRGLIHAYKIYGEKL